MPTLPAREPPEDPKTIILAPGGVRDVGFIDEVAAKAIGVEPGPIRLLYGGQGRTGGWGWVHLTSFPDRVAAIQGRGYPTCQAFVFAVAANWTEIHEATEPHRIKAVWPKDGYELGIVLEWSGTVWSVTTALPFRAAGKKKLYVKSTA